MVAIVTSTGAGLVNSSRDVLGAAGELGNSATGRAGERITVNAATGNLVIQDRDEYLVGIGPDVELLRTYNSVGAWDGDNNDGWRMGYYRRVAGLGGSVNTAGSTIKRMDADGHEATYYFNASLGKYLTAEGAGQFDSLSYSAGLWTWTDGDTATTETYASVDNGVTYRLNQVTDVEGHSVRVGYDGGGLINTLSTFRAGSSTSYEVVTLSYVGTELSRISTSFRDEQGAMRTRNLATRRLYYTINADGTLTRYSYDNDGHLSDRFDHSASFVFGGDRRAWVRRCSAVAATTAAACSRRKRRWTASTRACSDL